VTSKVLLFVLPLFGCGDKRHEQPAPPVSRPSLAPAKDASATVLIDHLGDHEQVLLAFARLPENYEFQELDGVALGNGVGRTPRIRINVGTLNAPTKEATGFESWIDANCRSTNPRQSAEYYVVTSHETHTDGFINVCSHREKGHTTELRVIRRWLWRGYPAQCEVAFMGPPTNRGELDPPEEQIKNAIAVCNTVRLETKPDPPRHSEQP
jgi:hypothetical protein